MPGSFIEKLLTSAIKNDRSYLVLVSGQQGIGKTSFAIHAAYIAYGNYAKALRRLYFEASDFFKDTASFTEPQLVAVFDDAGVWLSRQRWYEKDVVYLGNLLQLARNLFRLVIFTTPSENLPRQVITHLNYVVRAIGVQDGGRVTVGAIYRKSYTHAYEESYGRVEGIIRWPRRYPDDVYEAYNIIRAAKVAKFKAMAAVASGFKEEAKKALEAARESIDLGRLRELIVKLGGDEDDVKAIEERVTSALDYPVE